MKSYLNSNSRNSLKIFFIIVHKLIKLSPQNYLATFKRSQMTNMIRHPIILLREGKDTSQGLCQLISNH